MDHALRLAEALDADVIALHTFNVPVSAFEKEDEEQWAANERARLVDRMEEFLATGRQPGLKSDGKPVYIKTALVEDLPVEGIRSYISRFACDMVVMGTQGAHVLEDGRLGSRAASVLPYADVPLLVIPDGAVDRHPAHLVYAVDFQDHDRETLHLLQYMAQRFDARLTVLHIREHAVFDQSEEYAHFQELFRELMDDDRCGFDLVRGSDLRATLQDYLENREADWVVLRTRHRGEAAFASYSLSHELAWHARIPLLVFPAEA